MKLVMLPCAGGSSLMFQGVSDQLPATIQALPLDYAGHGRRADRPLNKQFLQIVDEIFAHLREINFNFQEAYAFLGYSMGSVISFELTKKIKQAGLPVPQRLFLCASAPVGYSKQERISSIPKGELYLYLKESGGTNQELLHNQDFQDYYYPIIEADLIAINNFELKNQVDLSVPVTVISGNEDKYSQVDVLAWQDYCQNCDFERLVGGHFFIYERTEELVEIISNKLI